jgi:acetyl esterase/lipase
VGVLFEKQRKIGEKLAIFSAALLLGGTPNGHSASPTTTVASLAKLPHDRWQPGHGLFQIPLWPEALPIEKPEVTGAETVESSPGAVAGYRSTAIRNVARPTLTIYPPKGHHTGAAIMVFPGGGYQHLAIDLEGSEICEWANAHGNTCAVLKYRVPQTWWHDDCDCQREPRPFLPLQDAERAMGLLRQRAASLGIDSHKIGVIGFSAGGHLATALSNARERSYAPVDAADTLSARPDFAMVLYPGHLWSGHGLELYPFDPVSTDCPPTFIVQAADDPVDDVRNAIAYFIALRAKKIPVEMHIYARGGHAFGLRPTAQPITRWPALAEKWLHTIGIV